MKTQIISDVHEDIEQVWRIMDAEPDVARVIFLGDWFDRWPTQPGDALTTARWLAENLQNPRYRFCWGNHDLPYCFPHPLLSCSGHQFNVKTMLLQEGVDFKPHFRLFHDEQGYRCSHAGFTSDYMQMPAEDLERKCQIAVDGLQLDQFRIHPLLGAGQCRGGDQEVGGCTWADWEEFIDYPKMPQIVGHSKAKKVRHRGGSVCLDTALHHYAVIENGELLVKEAPAK